ncbi:MAG: aldehyde dehydrogenase family protein [Thermogemmatispora sp.]|nr:aldehyde dehydrogenase family protein [Thermogemmatispora sp.]MBX5456521.1 aldehyde dehydrogenase family protein [Thermogemmatispora sp.]
MQLQPKSSLGSAARPHVETACGIPSLIMGYGLEDGAARGIDEEVSYQPLGVCAAITPFNFPFMIAFWFWPYAVACGNTFTSNPLNKIPSFRSASLNPLTSSASCPASSTLSTHEDAVSSRRRLAPWLGEHLRGGRRLSIFGLVV